MESRPKTDSLNHFAPGQLWPDTDGVHINAHDGGGVLLHDGVYYWFGEFKTAGEAGNRANVGVSVYASKNLYHWQNRGIALAVSDDPASDITRGCILERPKVIYNARTKRFVMWFHLEPPGVGYAGARVGVATAERVTGPYQLVRAFRPSAGCWPLDVTPKQRQPLTAAEAAIVAGPFPGGDGPEVQAAVPLIFRRDFAGGQMSRDMTLFVDDDEAAYHIAASEDNSTLHVARLSDDFLDTTGDYARVFPGRFHEAPSLFKHAGRYFMITSGCTGWAPNPARLSGAPSVLGPWTELGNPCVGDPAAVATTFDAQTTYIVPVVGRVGAFIFMADRWHPENAIDGRYVWLPVGFDTSQRPTLQWHDRWDLSIFDQ